MDRVIEFAGNHYILVSLFFALWVLFFITESRRAGATLTPQAATNRINRDNAVVVDIRDDDEFRKGHIAGSINIPVQKLNDRAGELEQYKDRPLILVCQNGARTGAAGRQLRGKGFDDIHRISGGLQAWRNDGLPVVKG
jgi:rhodanese-related sulfurtransferase